MRNNLILLNEILINNLFNLIAIHFLNVYLPQ